MKTQHTDGPWVVFPAPGLDIGSINRGFVASCTLRPSPEEMKANAALIAAAPDLLAACRCALADMEGSYSREDWDDDENPVALTIRELIAAIAKAGGDQ